MPFSGFQPIRLPVSYSLSEGGPEDDREGAGRVRPALWEGGRDTEISLPVRQLQGRRAETPGCWSLEFQLDATFADNFCHIFRQIFADNFIKNLPKIYEQMEFSWNSACMLQGTGIQGEK